MQVFGKLALIFNASINAFTSPTDIVSAGAELYSKMQFFSCTDSYRAVCEDEVGGSSVTIRTDLQKDFDIIQN